MKWFRYRSSSFNKKEVRREVEQKHRDKTIYLIEKSFRGGEYMMWIVWYGDK